VRIVIHSALTDAIPGHGDKKKSQQSLYLAMSDRDLRDAMDRMKFNEEEGENGVLFGNR